MRTLLLVLPLALADITGDFDLGSGSGEAAETVTFKFTTATPPADITANIQKEWKKKFAATANVNATDVSLDVSANAQAMAGSHVTGYIDIPLFGETADTMVAALAPLFTDTTALTAFLNVTGVPADFSVTSIEEQPTILNAPPSAPPPAEKKKGGLSGGQVAGIVIGVLAGVALIGGGGYYLYKKRQASTTTVSGAPLLP